MDPAHHRWTPLYDRAVALFLETVEGEMPALRRDADGQVLRGPTGQPVVAGGWPCRHFAEDWASRARLLLAEYEEARTQHRLCGKPDKPKENFAQLRIYLARCSEDPTALTGRDVGMIRKILASYVTRHGAPGSARLQATRAMQTRIAARPLHRVLAGVLADRLLRVYPEDEGAPGLLDHLGPLSPEEAACGGAPAGASLPASVVGRAMRCLQAPLGALAEQGIIPSLGGGGDRPPLLTARIRAAAIADPALARIYAAVYGAFRRRRSLLLLDLESQVRLDELPWISAIAPWVGTDESARDAARATLVEATLLAIETYPQTILPNRLVKELRALAAGAGLSVPLVDELAADIFLGAFSETFLRAAQVTARLLQGSLYERYYGLPYCMIKRLVVQ